MREKKQWGQPLNVETKWKAKKIKCSKLVIKFNYGFFVGCVSMDGNLDIAKLMSIIWTGIFEIVQVRY